MSSPETPKQHQYNEADDRSPLDILLEELTAVSRIQPKNFHNVSGHPEQHAHHDHAELDAYAVGRMMQEHINRKDSNET